MEVDHGEVRGPGDLRELGHAELVGVTAGRERDARRLDPLGALLGHPLLVDLLALDPVGKAPQLGRPLAQRAHDALADREVVADEVALRVARGRKQHLVGVRDLDDTLPDLDLDERRGHRANRIRRAPSSTIESKVMAGCGTLAPAPRIRHEEIPHMRKALIASLALAAALIVAATASGRPAGTTTAGRDSRLRQGQSRPARPTATLTVGADNPAFPPWFGGDEKTKPWKVSDPYSGKGYESAVAYAVAKQLGFAKSEVEVDVRPVQQLVPAGQEDVRLLHHAGLVQPAAREGGRLLEGVLLRQPVDRRPQGQADRLGALDQRAQEVQARRPDRDDELRLHRQHRSSRTRSRSSTTRTTRPCRRSRPARSTASSSTCRPRSTSRRCRCRTARWSVSSPSTGSKEHFGLVLQKGSKLTSCVNKALDRLWANGTIKNLQRIWLAKATGAPVLK